MKKHTIKLSAEEIAIVIHALEEHEIVLDRWADKHAERKNFDRAHYFAEKATACYKVQCVFNDIKK